MALFTDGTISTLEELRSYESAVYDVASTERIDLSQKLMLAQQELGIELTSMFFRENPEDLKRAVVTPPVRAWHIFHTLALFFRDAYNSHFNDRYLGKWREYERLANWARSNALATGVGVVGDPVPKAAPPRLSTAAGNAEAAMYWVRVAWVGPTGEEGCPSDPNVLSAPADTVPVAQAGEPPCAVGGWNVYVGKANDDIGLQNPAPIPVGASWVMPASGLSAGRAVGDGQAPSSYKKNERVLLRG